MIAPVAGAGRDTGGGALFDDEHPDAGNDTAERTVKATTARPPRERTSKVYDRPCVSSRSPRGVDAVGFVLHDRIPLVIGGVTNPYWTAKDGNRADWFRLTTVSGDPTYSDPPAISARNT
ncbi:MAG: hypothetical protein JWL83_2178 [Actinomycetia bacterium]|nr:hypothetical protein [Actinomycetes bacterium]